MFGSAVCTGTVFAVFGVKDLGICKRGGAGSDFRCNPEPELLPRQQVQGGCALWQWFRVFF